MPDVNAGNGHYEPIHSAHAIEQAVFSVQIEQPLADNQLAVVRKSAEQFTTELPGRAEIQGFRLGLGPVSPMGFAPPSSFGSVLNRTGPDGVVESELRIDRMSMTFRTTRYSCWSSVWADAKRYFAALLPIYASTPRNVKTISLSFNDKFVWSGDSTRSEPASLLRRGSKYLSPHVFETKDLWHTHTGMFLRADDRTKRLLNVNVDCLDEFVPQTNENRRVVAITTVLTDMLDQPGFASSDVTEVTAMTELEDRMQTLHILDKDILANIICDEMVRRIALVDQS